MIQLLSKWFLTLGLGAAAITALPTPAADTTPTATSTLAADATDAAYPLTAEELSTSLHDHITALRESAELARLNLALPLVRPLLSGTRGTDVSTLQEWLMKIEYLSPDSGTGYYGNSTIAAVKKFQEDFYMPQTGIVDRATLDKIMAIYIHRENFDALYFPEEAQLLGMATSSEALLQEANSSGTNTDTSTGDAATVPAILPTVQNITITATNSSLTPNTLTVRKGDILIVHYTAVTGTHNFVVDGYNVKTGNVAQGKSTDVTFPAVTAGTFNYYSSNNNDKSQGLIGTLTVTNTE